jgi:transposase InsO family protein
VTWSSASSPAPAATSCGSLTSRTPHPRGQAVLRGGAGCLFASGGRLVDRRCTDRGAGDQRARDGDRDPQAGCWDADPFRSGVQFTSWAFSQRAKASGLVPSMGGVGACFDNAMIESFWSRMQVELLDPRRWRTRLELANAIFEYLELFHNRQRRRSSLGMLSPIEFENRQPTTVA